MGHGITQTDRMFSRGETPWHAHERCAVVDHVGSVDEFLRLTELDYECTALPGEWKYTVTEPVAEGDDETVERTYIVPVTTHRAVIRKDTGTVLGMVGNKYTHLQNSEAFGVLQPLVDQGLARLETGGSLHGGIDTWLMVEFTIDNPIVQDVFGNAGIVPYGLISNNHVGWRPVVVQNTPIRVVCRNTLGAALGSRQQSVRIRHTSSVAIRTVEAAMKLWGELVERRVELAEQYKALMNLRIDEKMFRKLVLDVVAAMPKEYEAKDLSKRQETARDKVLAKRDAITKLWGEGIGHTGDGSAYEAYNAVTQFLDHDEEFIKIRGATEEEKALKRQERLMDRGEFFEIKGQVFKNLLDLASKKPVLVSVRKPVGA